MLKMLVSAYECEKDRIVNKLLSNKKKITSRVIVNTLIDLLVCSSGRPYLTADRMVISCNRKSKEYFFVIRGHKTLGIYTLFTNESMYSKLKELHVNRTNDKDVSEGYIVCIRDLVSDITAVYR